MTGWHFKRWKTGDHKQYGRWGLRVLGVTILRAPVEYLGLWIDEHNTGSEPSDG